MKTLTLAAFIFSVLATVAHAQVTAVADVAGGYSFIEVVKGYYLLANGGSGSLSFNVNNWLGAVGDFGVYHASPVGPGLLAETYSFGPRFSYRRWDRLIPFGQFLLGGGHASQTITGFTGVTNAFAFGAGGGADIGLGSDGRFALRPQVEYLGFRGTGVTTGTVRVSVGIVFRIGKK